MAEGLAHVRTPDDIPDDNPGSQSCCHGSILCYAVMHQPVVSAPAYFNKRHLLPIPPIAITSVSDRLLGLRFCTQSQQILLDRQERARGGFQLFFMYVSQYRAIESLNILSNPLQQLQCLFSQIDPVNPAIGRIDLSNDKACRLKTINQCSKGDLSQIETVGESGLRQAIVARYKFKHPPLRARNSKRCQGPVEHKPSQPGDIMDEASEAEIKLRLIDHGGAGWPGTAMTGCATSLHFGRHRGREDQ